MIRGGAGDDHLLGGDGDDVLQGGDGRDTLDGGNGVDWVDYSITNLGTTVDLTNNRATYSTSTTAFETLVSIENAQGGGGADTLIGNANANYLSGLGGADVLYGLGGSDFMWGGAGADRFYYGALTDSRAGAVDRIMDFLNTDGDRIDLRSIDANTRVAGDQAFSFLGNGAFTGAGAQLRIDALLSAGAGEFMIYGDVNGDRAADFQIQVHHNNSAAGWGNAFLL